MSDLADLLYLLLALPVLIVVLLIQAAPEVLAGWLFGKRDDAVRRAAEQAELERKIAIAEAGIEARRRGEAFVPPADYNR